MHFMYQQFTEMRNDYPPLLVALTKFRRQMTEQIFSRFLTVILSAIY